MKNPKDLNEAILDNVSDRLSKMNIELHKLTIGRMQSPLGHIIRSVAGKSEYALYLLDLDAIIYVDDSLIVLNHGTIKSKNVFGNTRNRCSHQLQLADPNVFDNLIVLAAKLLAHGTPEDKCTR